MIEEGFHKQKFEVNGYKINLNIDKHEGSIVFYAYSNEVEFDFRWMWWRYGMVHYHDIDNIVIHEDELIEYVKKSLESYVINAIEFHYSYSESYKYFEMGKEDSKKKNFDPRSTNIPLEFFSYYYQGFTGKSFKYKE